MTALKTALEDLYFHENSATCQRDSVCIEVKQFCTSNDEGLVALRVSGDWGELDSFKASNGAIYLSLNEISALIIRLDSDKFRELRRYLKDSYDQMIYLHLQKDGLETCGEHLSKSLVYPARLAHADIAELADQLQKVKCLSAQ